MAEDDQLRADAYLAALEASGGVDKGRLAAWRAEEPSIVLTELESLLGDFAFKNGQDHGLFLDLREELKTRGYDSGGIENQFLAILLIGLRNSASSFPNQPDLLHKAAVIWLSFIARRDVFGRLGPASSANKMLEALGDSSVNADFEMLSSQQEDFRKLPDHPQLPSFLTTGEMAALEGTVAAVEKFLETIEETEEVGNRDVQDSDPIGREPTSRKAKVDADSTSLEALSDLARAVPNQDSLVRIGVSDNGKLTFLPTEDSDGNDNLEVIEVVKAELLDAIATLMERYEKNANTPQAQHFAPLVARYREALLGAPINVITLYARGRRLFSTRDMVARQIDSDEWPDYEPEEGEAINTVCDLHGSLIMASAVGRKLVDDAHVFDATPNEFKVEQEVLREFGAVVANEPDLIEPDDAEDLRTLTEVDTRQPGRNRRLLIGFAASALPVLIGTVAGSMIVGGVLGGVVGAVAGVGIRQLSFEGFKNSKAGQATTRDIARMYDELDERAAKAFASFATRSSEFVRMNHDLLARVSKLRPEFSWFKKQLSKSTQHVTDHEATDEEEKFAKAVSSFSKAVKLRGNDPRVRLKSDLGAGSQALWDSDSNTYFVNPDADLEEPGLAAYVALNGRFFDQKRDEFKGSSVDLDFVAKFRIGVTEYVSFSATGSTDSEIYGKTSPFFATMQEIERRSGSATATQRLGIALLEDIDSSWSRETFSTEMLAINAKLRLMSDDTIMEAVAASPF